MKKEERARRPFFLSFYLSIYRKRGKGERNSARFPHQTNRASLGMDIIVLHSIERRERKHIVASEGPGYSSHSTRV